MTALLRLPPLLLPLCLFICGIGAAGSYGLLLPRSILWVALTALLTAFFLRSPFLLKTAACLTLLAAGNFLIQPFLQRGQEDRPVIDLHAREKLNIEGVIVSRPEPRDGGWRLAIRADKVADEGGTKVGIHGLLLLRIGKSGRYFASGDRISFAGKLKAPRNFGITGEFDQERSFALKGIAATAFVKSDDEVVLVDQGVEARFQRHFDTTAAAVGRFIMDSLPGVEGGIMKALLVGDASAIPQQTRDQYSRTGVNHILSISGFHIGIIALALLQGWLALSMLFPAILLRINFRRLALLASMPLIGYYLFLSGAAPATARSVIMLLLLAASLLLEREIDPVNTLALAAFALLLINPANLYDLSFQLSFLAMWGLTVITPLLAHPFKSVADGWRHQLVLFTVASIAAVAVTLLPVAHYFQQTSVTGVISNFFIVPLLGYGAVVTGFVALPFIRLAPLLANFLLQIAGFLTSVANELISILAKVPSLPLFIPTEAELGFFLVGLLLFTVLRDKRAKTSVMAVIPLALVLLHQLPAEPGSDALRIDFLSVGQGESTLITFADGRRMLIDGGGALHESGWDVGRHLLLPALRKMGVRKIDYLVLTHAHPDHLQGVKSVAGSMPVGEFWESGFNNGEEYLELRKILALKGVPVKFLDSATPTMAIAGTSIQCLYPLSSGIRPSDLNETSLTLRLEAAGHSALFTGDIGFEAETRLMERKNALRSTLLKVPHHGSRYSTGPDFLDAVSPRIALISAGYNNSFGLPSQETVNQLSSKGISIYRTDLDGTITAKFPMRGENLVISAFKRQFD